MVFPTAEVEVAPEAEAQEAPEAEEGDGLEQLTVVELRERGRVLGVVPVAQTVISSSLSCGAAAAAAATSAARAAAAASAQAAAISAKSPTLLDHGSLRGKSRAVQRRIRWFNV
jgi:hypothetical protein